MLTTTVRHDPVIRALTVSTAASAASKGLMFTVSALYLTRVAGLDPGVVGLGLTAAGILAIATTFITGRLCDRHSTRTVMTGSALAQGVALGGYCLTRDTTSFVLLACLAVGAQGVQRTAQVTLIAQVFTGPGRTDARARLRVVTNVFIALGSGVGALALAVGTASVYQFALLLAAALVFGSAWPLRALPAGPVEPMRAPNGPSVLHDRRYLTVAALQGVISVQFALLTVGMPLWVADHTRAPEVLIGVLLVLNTGLVVLFQVGAARQVRDVRTAGRVVFAATALLALSCVLYPAAALPGAVGAAGILVMAVLAHSFGEVLSEAGGWELAFELADSSRPGTYQGVSQTGVAIGVGLAPLTVTSSAIAHGLGGWLLLGGVFLAAGAGTHAVSRERQLTPR